MRGRRHKLQVSTFPFLAVLLCAMGSLILVLLVMDRKAHRAAQARAQREAAKLVEESARNESARQAEREKLKEQARKEWEKKRDALHDKLTREQVEMQLQMRKIREELQGIAARLHYEQDTTTQLRRKTQDQRSRLQAEEQLLRTLRSSAKQSENQSKESSQALRRMTLDLLQMEQVLKDLKTSRQREQKTFSVVPYHGRRGENRRPIYVECSADGVVFHPEHKAMPLVALIPGSGDAAGNVRAEVERRIALQRQKLAALPPNVDKTPYLLLLLRPSGVTTYHLFQRALRGLPLDFGYEFIDDDWVLDFPADDELPSSQPWMIATKTPARPASPATVPAAGPPRTSTRPRAGAPMGGPGGPYTGGIRGFRAGEVGGNGSWAKGDANPSGLPSGTTSGGGSGRGMVGGNGVPGFSGGSGGAGATTARGANAGFSGSPAGFGNEGNRFGSSGGSASMLVNASGGTGTASTSGGAGAGYSRGNGRGHPSAMPPSFPSNEGGADYPGDGRESGAGFRGFGGPLRLGGSGVGSGSGSGYSLNGSPGTAGSGMPGLGPPRALSSGGTREGESGSGAGSSALAGTGSTGSGIPGYGGRGGGTTGSGIPGSGAGTGVPGDGRYVIARGNNLGETSGSALSGGGGTGVGGGGGTGVGGGGTGVDGGGTGGGSGTGVSGGGGGTGSGGGGVGAGAGGGGTATAGMPGNGESFSTMPINSGSYPSQQGPGGSSSGTGQTANSGGIGAGGTAIPGAPGGGVAGNGTQISVSPAQLGDQRSDSNPNPQGAVALSQGSGTIPSGTTKGIGAASNGQAPAGTAASANSGRTPDAVVFVDPLTGQPTTAPRPPPSSDDGSAEAPPPDEMDGNRGKRRIQVVPVDAAGNTGDYASGSSGSAAMNRSTPMPMYTPPPRRLSAPRPAWVHGGRDWTIYVECRATDLVLYPSQRTFPLSQAVGEPAANPLIKAIQQMIQRRQSSRRPGEPPYHPQLCLLVHPEHIRTFLNLYPALEALPMPKTRRNLDADDDVIGIVTGAVP